jgi:hypothetical protein
MTRWLLAFLALLAATPALAIPGDGSYRGRISCAASEPHPTTGQRHPAWSREGFTLTIVNGSLRGGATGQHRSGVRWSETWNGAVRDGRVSVLAQGSDPRNDPWVYVMTGPVPGTRELVLNGTMYVRDQRHRVCEFRGTRAG